MPSSDRIGVLLVGGGGATASTAVAGATLMAAGLRPRQYGITAAPPFDTTQFVDVAHMGWGGWDLRPVSLADAVAFHRVLRLGGKEMALLDNLHFEPGIRTSLDIPVEHLHSVGVMNLSLNGLIEQLVEDVTSFRDSGRFDRIIVIYLGSPPREPSGHDFRKATLDELRALDSDVLSECVPSCVIYALAACVSGAAFIDFTPSPALEYESVHQSASEHGVQLAGRDGSTGQTMLKLWLAELFRDRALQVDSWYSTNLIGNHDGYVLSLDGHDEIKLRDKSDGLALFLDEVPDHHVAIEFMPSWGDDKESWDAVRLKGWMGSRAELRLNWRGQDSFLAAPIILDLVRLIARGFDLGFTGFQPQLGYFFKRPFRREGIALSQLRDELRSSYGRT